VIRCDIRHCVGTVAIENDGGSEPRCLGVNYAQDLAPLVAQHCNKPVTSRTYQTTVAFLAAQEHLQPAHLIG
jgi:hypothetical protein